MLLESAESWLSIDASNDLSLVARSEPAVLRSNRHHSTVNDSATFCSASPTHPLSPGPADDVSLKDPMREARRDSETAT
jgi:hypothetical protein